MLIIRNLACWLGLLMTAQVAEATVLFFTDRASFENAVSVSQTVDFESSFPFSNTAITFGDATFVSTDGTGIHRTAPGAFGNSTTTLAAQNSGGIRIDLASGYFAIGLDVGELFGPASAEFSLSGSSALLASRIATVGFLGDNPSFVGWLSSDEIRSLDILFAGQSEFEAIDNVALGDARIASIANVPEPATLVLLSLGLAGIGIRLRPRSV